MSHFECFLSVVLFQKHWILTFRFPAWPVCELPKVVTWYVILKNWYNVGFNQHKHQLLNNAEASWPSSAMYCGRSDRQNVRIHFLINHFGLMFRGKSINVTKNKIKYHILTKIWNVYFEVLIFWWFSADAAKASLISVEFQACYLNTVRL